MIYVLCVRRLLIEEGWFDDYQLCIVDGVIVVIESILVGVIECDVELFCFVYIDIYVYGGVGVDVMDDVLDVFDKLVMYKVCEGVGSWLSIIVIVSFNIIYVVLKCIV